MMRNSNRASYKKLTNCPKRRKDSSLESWIGEVKMWNDAHRDPDSNVQKYLNFIENVRASDDCDGLIKFVEVNVVENKSIKKDDEDTIANILALIEKNLGKGDLEVSTEGWNEFIEIEQKADEDVKDFVTRYEQVVTKLKNVKINMPQKALAIHLLKKSNLTEASKENIMTKVNTDEHDELYTSVAKVMRELKTLVSNGKEKEENKTFFTGNSRRNNSRRGSANSNNYRDNRYRRSKSRQRYQRNSSNERHRNYGGDRDRNYGAERDRTYGAERNRYQGRDSRYSKENGSNRESRNSYQSERNNSSVNSSRSSQGRRDSSSHNKFITHIMMIIWSSLKI